MAGLNFAASIGKKAKEDIPVTNVQVEGIVVAKIIKHCKECLPNFVTGQLLGLDIGSTLEITYSFPFPNKVEEAGGDEDEDASYQLEMMRCLREVNVDNNTVGWYQSTFVGSYQTLELVETFMSYQESIKRCVCIVYDPQEAAQGSFGLKVLKLKEKFLNLFKEGKVTATTLNQEGVTSKDMFQELPITVTNSSLVSAMFNVLQSDGQADQGTFDRLTFVEPDLLERNLEFMMESVDEYHGKIYQVSQYHRMSARHELQHQQWLQKRKQENAARRAAGEDPLTEEDPNYTPLTEPSRMESFLISNQTTNFSEKVVTLGGQALQKLCIVESLYQK
ncbi:subunit H of translation initiation factor 3 [Chloropicon primus]|uniref:Eukaryotic translation initiation factor 3 subunit H n=1 Tax=Chloropicon primus TaxID=1764295 RepID=A0A5B8MWX1_9CHLO|nr:subunit H of translation initiation factor 3 [Chloropicon primus]UPR04251.1 subunit H of translation initiation factor 3 [Chloropicon primus]|mmetsp:Transcript_4790/g.14280  ORF Transcript_4790/g.14280 Transcript_4790/m.14280 type:complete len:334 (+) Transcript_4790:1368-2369(+)|eukprot:QDZ25043.1 subunit H of translation initiation factor 3 [Chloropicon primus]